MSSEKQSLRSTELKWNGRNIKAQERPKFTIRSGALLRERRAGLSTFLEGEKTELQLGVITAHRMINYGRTL